MFYLQIVNHITGNFPPAAARQTMWRIDRALLHLWQQLTVRITILVQRIAARLWPPEMFSILHQCPDKAPIGGQARQNLLESIPGRFR
ncbi:hypothetical protein FHY55_10170 [Oceanicola sp. D3]|uniref:hypothetical protein n=1 Tax=Oceanicola sp. D3 TaxID=2587163 RepID=UPI0011223B0C|nr:hypothetical protein [Oceanicola sp. D3]QDC09585.1 hypothetical protein FHY55_10170 [Oceanicola sp. D3]